MLARSSWPVSTPPSVSSPASNRHKKKALCLNDRVPCAKEVRMLSKLLRIVTVNYFLLGFIFKPKWKKERNKIKGMYWEERLALRPSSGRTTVTEWRALLRECFPWMSPQEIQYICNQWSKRSQYIIVWCTSADYGRLLSYSKSNCLCQESKHRSCCSGEIIRGQCGCVEEGDRFLLLPQKPTLLEG
jgi:hypothetical protein